MKRRGFLKRLAGVATAAVVSERVIPDDGVSLYSAAHPVSTEGFGLAPIKAEGATIPYDLSEESLEQVCIDVHEQYRWVTSRRLFDFRRRVIDAVEIDVREGDGADLYHLMRFKIPR
jgi:hypothetical protein